MIDTKIYRKRILTNKTTTKYNVSFKSLFYYTSVETHPHAAPKAVKTEDYLKRRRPARGATVAPLCQYDMHCLTLCLQLTLSS